MINQQKLLPINTTAVVLSQVKKDKNIIYGGRAVNAQLQPRIFGYPVFGKSTRDYDIYSGQPEKSAKKLERRLNKNYHGHYFYEKPALHHGTFKVMDVGQDLKENTRDDFNIVDFTKPSRKVQFTTIQGIRYAKLSERAKDAIRALKNPKFAFRHHKDREDLARIELHKQFGGE